MTNAIYWILAIILFLIIETTTPLLISIWFAGGALAAMAASLCGAGTGMQIFVFLAVSVLCIVLLRGAAIKSVGGKQKKTNLDRVIGQEIVITSDVDNRKNSGTAMINDVEWKVKSEDGEEIPAGETATVTGIEGVKLIVKK